MMAQQQQPASDEYVDEINVDTHNGGSTFQSGYTMQAENDEAVAMTPNATTGEDVLDNDMEPLRKSNAKRAFENTNMENEVSEKSAKRVSTGREVETEVGDPGGTLLLLV